MGVINEGAFSFSFQVDPKQLDDITKRLDGIAYKSPTVLKNASNETTKKALVMLQEEIDTRYAYEGHGGGRDSLKKHLKRKVATYANPRNVIEIKDVKKEVIDFDVSHRYPPAATDQSSWVQGHLLKRSSRVHLTHAVSGKKAFVAQFKSGHVSVVARNPGKDRSGNHSDRKIETIMGLSYAQMASGGFQEIEEKVGATLEANVEKQIRKVMERVNG